MNIKEIEENADNLVEGIREYSRSQKGIWQRIPHLALEAQGRTGYIDNWQRAYQIGYWLPHSHRGGEGRVVVDLVEGELVDAFHASSAFAICDRSIPKKSHSEPADDYAVLGLVDDIEELNAQKIISGLEQHIKKGYSKDYDPQEQEKWRASERKKYHVTQIFTRK